MVTRPSTSYLLQLATSKKTMKRAVRIAILVGVILNLINHPEILTSLSFEDQHAGRIVLTFLVPFLVSTYSSVLSESSLKP